MKLEPKRRNGLMDNFLAKVIMAVLIVIAMVLVSGFISSTSGGGNQTDKDMTWIPAILGTVS